MTQNRCLQRQIVQEKNRSLRIETELGYAPDLNGWGSREWLVGIITDPTHQRFYPEDNDRMPSFGVGRDGGTPTLTEGQIGLLADWLRNTWYRPADH